LYCLHVGGIAINRDILPPGIDSDIQYGFEVFDVLIVNTKQRLKTPGRKFNLLQLLKRSPSDSLINYYRSKWWRELLNLHQVALDATTAVTNVSNKLSASLSGKFIQS
jgi:hypothetical protein